MFTHTPNTPFSHISTGPPSFSFPLLPSFSFPPSDETRGRQKQKPLDRGVVNSEQNKFALVYDPRGAQGSVNIKGGVKLYLLFTVRF
jgi:hypothetical protein